VSLANEPVAGIHCLPVPTPFAVGPVNCYLLRGDPLTLIDTGPNSGSSLDFLERGLAECGMRIEDLELIVLTHQHMDHEGLLEIVARRSGAEVAAFAPLVPWVADYPASASGDDAYAQSVMTASGVPADLIALLGVLAAGVRAYGSNGTVTRPLSDGDSLTMGSREFTVHHRPGHSRSDLVFHHGDSGVLIGGDHLLARISSNALVSRPLDGDTSGPRPTPLITYGNSLRATREMDVSEILTGHGATVTDHVELIDARLNDVDRRARKILGLVADKPLTAHEIAREMWGEIALKQAYLTLSEVLGHLDLLLEAGTVSETQNEGVSRFGVA
jgi:glyoxylase-like metal-dependent hydrolase (beta-lactamase superfamily II)